MSTSTVTTSSYDESSITVLEGLEAVQQNPGMYIGGIGQAGLHHLVYEVIDNAVDECLVGFCDNILVRLGAGRPARGSRQGRRIRRDGRRTTAACRIAAR